MISVPIPVAAEQIVLLYETAPYAEAGSYEYKLGLLKTKSAAQGAVCTVSEMVELSSGLQIAVWSDLPGHCALVSVVQLGQRAVRGLPEGPSAFSYRPQTGVIV